MSLLLLAILSCCSLGACQNDAGLILPVLVTNDTQPVALSEPRVFEEDFNNLDRFKTRWIKYDKTVAKAAIGDFKGEWTLVWAKENTTDLCLSTVGREKRYGMAATLDQVVRPSELGQLVVQFDHKFNKRHCFNLQVKLSHEPSGTLRDLTSVNTDYELVVQQDVCKQQIEFHQSYKVYDPEKNHSNLVVRTRRHVESLHSGPDGNVWHTTRLVVHLNNTYELSFDGKTVQSGSFFRLLMTDVIDKRVTDYRFYERSLLERMGDISDVRVTVAKKEDMIKDNGDVAIDNIVVKVIPLTQEQDQMIKESKFETEKFKMDLDANLALMREDIESRQDDNSKLLLKEDFNKGENFVDKWIKLKQNLQKDIGDYTGDWYLIVRDQAKNNDYAISTRSDGEKTVKYGLVNKLDKMVRPADLEQLVIQYELKFHKYPCFKFQFNLFNDPGGFSKYVEPKSLKYPSINIRQAVCDQQVTLEGRYRIQAYMYDGKVNTSEVFVKDDRRVTVGIGHYPAETLWHTTRLVINRDNTYELTFDGVTVKSGTFFNMTRDGFDHHYDQDNRFYGSDIMSKLFTANAVMINVRKESEMSERELVIDNVVIKVRTNGNAGDNLQDNVNSDNSNAGPESVKSYIDRNLKEMKDNVVNTLLPIGFIYTQLPDQSSPQELWPNLKWSDVTQEHSGLFADAKEDSKPENESNDQKIKLFKRIE